MDPYRQYEMQQQNRRSTSEDQRRESSVKVETVYETLPAQDRTMTQPIFVRYLEPPPSTSEISEVELQQQALPPIVLVQHDEQRDSPDPIVYRELPPISENEKFLNIKQPRRQPRPIVIEKIPRAHAKPPAILIERWLPRSQPKVVLSQQQQQQREPLKRKVLVVERSRPNVRVVKEFINLGTRKVSEQEYMQALAKTAEKAKLNGKSVFIEARVDKNTFNKHVSGKPATEILDTAQLMQPLTMINSGEARI